MEFLHFVVFLIEFDKRLGEQDPTQAQIHNRRSCLNSFLSSWVEVFYIPLYLDKKL